MGWIGEVEGLGIYLAGAGEKLTRLDQPTTVNLDMPDLSRIAGYTVRTSQLGVLAPVCSSFRESQRRPQ